MIEMRVRTVDHDPRSGRPVAVLLPRDLASWAPLAIGMQPREACSLSHELERQSTPRARAFDLLFQSLRAIGAYTHSVVVRPGVAGEPAARLRVRLPDRQIEQPIDVALALGLAVHYALPIMVSAQLAHAAVAAAPDAPEASNGASVSSVPAAFHRALDEHGCSGHASGE